MSGPISAESSMAHILTNILKPALSALRLACVMLLLASPESGLAHKAELSSWLTLQRDASGWIGLVEVRVPAKLLELGVSMADVNRDGTLSEQEFSALARDYVRRVVAAVDIQVNGQAQTFGVQDVSWKGQGKRTLDIVASLRVEKPRKLKTSSEELRVVARRGAGTVILAVQSQLPWLLGSVSGGAELGPDQRGFAKPFSLIAERLLQVDLVEAQPAR